MNRQKFHSDLRKKVNKEIDSAVWRFAEKTIALTSKNDYSWQKWWKKQKLVLLFKKQLLLHKNFSKALLLFSFLKKSDPEKLRVFLGRFFYWYLTSELLNDWENISNHALKSSEFTNKHQEKTFFPGQKVWNNKFPKMDFDDVEKKMSKKITNAGIFLGNIFQSFFLEVEQYKNADDLNKGYELGFYLGVFISICKLQKKNFFSIKSKEKNHNFLLTKMFVNLQYTEILKIYLPKNYNFFIMNFNFFNY